MTSKRALNAILRSLRESLAKTRWNVCLKSDEANESPMTRWPPVEFGHDFISSRPVWSTR